MKKRITFVFALLSLIPFGKPFLITTGVALSTSGIMIFTSKNTYANDATYYFKSALEKQSKKDYLGAINDYSKAIEIDPEGVSSYYNRGSLKEKLKDYKGAIKDHTRAIEIYKKYGQEATGDIYLNRGNAKYYLKDYLGAIDDYTKSIESDARNGQEYGDAFYNRGNAYKDIGDIESACTDYLYASYLQYQKVLLILPFIKNSC